MVKAMGVSVHHGNGNDVEEVFRIVKNAKTSIFQGGGPQFLEFDTYRWREHCGPNYDNDIGYREESEFFIGKRKILLKISILITLKNILTKIQKKLTRK